MAAPRTFYIHERRSRAVLVKQGFSWPAFLFGALWAAAKHMWLPAFWAMAVMDTVLWFLSGYAEARGASDLALCTLLLTLGYAWVRGRFGNRWLVASLTRRGYARGKTRPG